MNFSRFLNYVNWSNTRMLEMLRSCPQIEPNAIGIFGHLLASQHLWLFRLQGKQPDISLWPQLGLDECQGLIEMNFTGYKDYLKSLTPQKLESSVSYRTTENVEYQNLVSDLLVHVLNHGTYHRGQITAAVKRSGGAIINTDYITFVREIPEEK